MSAPHVMTVTGAPDGVDIVVTCPDPKTCRARQWLIDDVETDLLVCAFADKINDEGAEALDRVVVGPDLSLLDVMFNVVGADSVDDSLLPGTYKIFDVSIDAGVDLDGRSVSFLAAAETVEFEPLPPASVDSAWLRRHALGTLSGWLPGYTDPDEYETQHKIKLVAIDERTGALHVEVKAAGQFSTTEQDGQAFIVDVTVTAVP